MAKISNLQPVFEGPVAEGKQTKNKKWGMKKNKEKRNRDIWGGDGRGETVEPPSSHPRDLRAAPCPKSLTPKLTAIVWALRVGGISIPNLQFSACTEDCLAKEGKAILYLR